MSPKYELLVIALITDDLRNAICACLENIIGLKLPSKPPLADVIAIIKISFIDMAWD
jgi:hypothetical protein